MQEASTEHYFVFDFVLFSYNFFWPVIGVRHRETTETLGRIFIKSEMGGFKFIKGFQKLTYTHLGGFNGTLFWLRVLCFFRMSFFGQLLVYVIEKQLKHW